MILNHFSSDANPIFYWRPSPRLAKEPWSCVLEALKQVESLVVRKSSVQLQSDFGNAWKDEGIHVC